MMLGQNQLPDGCELSKQLCNECEGFEECSVAIDGGHCTICNGCENCWTTENGGC